MIYQLNSIQFFIEYTIFDVLSFLFILCVCGFSIAVLIFIVLFHNLW